MAQFDVCSNLGASSEQFPWLIILQPDLLDTTGTSIVAPLDRSAAYKKALRVYPELQLHDEPWLIIIPQLAAVPNHFLGEVVENAGHLRQEILSALDRVFTGIG